MFNNAIKHAIFSFFLKSYEINEPVLLYSGVLNLSLFRNKSVINPS